MQPLTQEQKTYYLEQLFELLRIPSISTLSEHKKDIKQAVEWLSHFISTCGFAKDEIQTLYAKNADKERNHPVLFASRIDNPDNPTLLIYGHYDVQPVDPLNEWTTPPFEPEVRDGNIYARGSTDDKGQVFTHLAALHILSQQWEQSWPVNIKLLIEGEEEAGGENIEALVSEHKDDGLFAADVCLISDTAFVANNQPSIDRSLRGVTYMQIDVRSTDKDLHSGLFGGGVRNPATALAHMLATLKDPNTGEIRIPGIYGAVVPLDKQERERLAAIPFSEKNFLHEAGNAKAPFGEKDYTTVERTTARPALDINGMWSGFIGEGAKTIIPATAHAKVSIRTVANQDPHEVYDLFVAHMKAIAPPEVSVEIKKIHAGEGVDIDVDTPGMKRASQAIQETFGKPPVYTRVGGSIPIVAHIKNTLGIDPVLVGYGLPDDGLHGPNEKFSLEQFYKGIECNMRLYALFAQK